MYLFSISLAYRYKYIISNIAYIFYLKENMSNSDLIIKSGNNDTVASEEGKNSMIVISIACVNF